MKNQHQGIVWAPILIIVATIVAVSVAGYFLFKAGNTNQSESTNVAVVNQANNNANVNLNTNIATNTNQVANNNVSLNTNTSANTNASTDATKDWETYTDEKYDFIVKYPSSWSTKLYTTGYNDEGPYVVVFSPNNPPGPLPFISVRENWTIKQEVDRINSRDEFTKVTSQKETTIGGIQGTAVTYSTAIGSTPTSFIVIRGSSTLIFNAVPNQTNWQTLIGTLLFNTDPTAGWKTYTNTAHGYTIKYPNNYKVNLQNENPSIEEIGSMEKSALEAVFVTVITATNTNDTAAQDLYQWAKDGFPKTSPITQYHSNQTTLKLGENVFVRTDGDTASSAIPEYLIFLNNKLYALYRNGKSSVNESIISTLHFTN